MATKIITIELTEEEIADVKGHCEDEYTQKSWGASPNSLFTDESCQSVFMKTRDAILQQ